MRTLIFAYSLKLENRRVKYEVIPGIPGAEDMTTMDLTLWFGRVVPTLKVVVPKAVIGFDSTDLEGLEAKFVQTVGDTIDAVFAPARVVVMRAEAVTNMINSGVSI